MSAPDAPPMDQAISSLAREPQQARSRRTLERLRDAAWTLLEDGGPEAVTVTGVSTLAGVSVGSFYARFEGKDELLGHLEAVALAAGLKSWREAVERPEVDIHDLVREVAALYRSGPARRLLLLARADGRSPKRLEELQRAVAESLAERLPEPDGGSALLRAAALSVAARELALAFANRRESWLFADGRPRPDEPEEAIVRALAPLLRGEATPDPEEVPAGEPTAEKGPEAPPSDAAERAPDAPVTDAAEVAGELAAEPETEPGLVAEPEPGSEPEPDPETDPEPGSDEDAPPAVELFDVWG